MRYLLITALALILNAAGYGAVAAGGGGPAASQNGQLAQASDPRQRGAQDRSRGRGRFDADAAEEPDAAPEEQAEARAGDSEQGPQAGAETAADTLSEAEALTLADDSGCKACHELNERVVGPSWTAIGDRYRGQAGARAQLIEAVKQGAKGNWTNVTGGVSMPPYSPQVPDEDIEELVDFILNL